MAAPTPSFEVYRGLQAHRSRSTGRQLATATQAGSRQAGQRRGNSVLHGDGPTTLHTSKSRLPVPNRDVRQKASGTAQESHNDSRRGPQLDATPKKDPIFNSLKRFIYVETPYGELVPVVSEKALAMERQNRLDAVRGVSRGADKAEPFQRAPEPRAPSRGFSRGSLTVPHDSLEAPRDSMIAARSASRGGGNSSALPMVMTTGPRPGSVQAASLFNLQSSPAKGSRRPKKRGMSRILSLATQVAQLKDSGLQPDETIAELESKCHVIAREAGATHFKEIEALQQQKIAELESKLSKASAMDGHAMERPSTSTSFQPLHAWS